MEAQKILSGEVASKKARSVLYPLLIVLLLNFISSVVRSQITGYSGFTSGTLDRTGYSVVEHGHTIHVSVAQYWPHADRRSCGWRGSMVHHTSVFFPHGRFEARKRPSKDALEPAVNK
jgi:hypothetical protein